MKCSNCEGEFSTDEAVKVEGTNRSSNNRRVIAHECPFCSEPLSMRFTRMYNVNHCPHNATVDHNNTEVCSQCGHIFGGGIKEVWAIPATKDSRLQNSDAELYWG